MAPIPGSAGLMQNPAGGAGRCLRHLWGSGTSQLERDGAAEPQIPCLESCEGLRGMD